MRELTIYSKMIYTTPYIQLLQNVSGRDLQPQKINNGNYYIKSRIESKSPVS